jgi:HSP20 family protein
MTEKKPTRSLATWDPFDELDLFRSWSPFRELGMSRLGRLFDERFGALAPAGRLVPAVDISEDDDRYVVSVEVPGAKKEDVTVESDDNVLTIRGEKRSEREEKKEQTRYVERVYGSFSRSFTLPPNVAADRVSASFKDGVLSVEIPKREEKKPKVVSIKS